MWHDHFAESTSFEPRMQELAKVQSQGSHGPGLTHGASKKRAESDVSRADEEASCSEASTKAIFIGQRWPWWNQQNISI
jgi:hypothetical protein